MLLLLACSIDSQLQDKTDPQDTQLAVDSDPVDTVDTVDTADSAVPVEECNGLDDDGDGEVDEDFGDYDGDGIVDCLDDACVLEQTEAGSVPIDDACSSSGWEPPTNPWDYTVSWTATGGRQYSPPAILRTTDQNGDGVLDADDPPDIYSVDLYGFTLWRFAGDGSSAGAVASDVHISSVALGDVDQDGVPNVVTARHTTQQVCALEPDGTVLWCSAEVTGSTGGSPVLSDLDHDGAVEVIDVGGVADGATGTLEAELCTPAGFFTQVALGDVDGDGTDEVLCGLALYRADGTILFDVSDEDDVVSTSFVDGNLDGTPEILSVDLLYGLRMYDLDGNIVASALGSGLAVFSPQCVADIDGDGDAEIGVAFQSEFQVYDLDLHTLWTTPISDPSGDASCSAFDLDGDGAAEFIYADEQALHVYTGAGTEVLTWTDHNSGSSLEYPTIADLDGDGDAEIIVAEDDGGTTGIAVLTHATTGWSPAEAVWADNAGIGGAVLVDGTVNLDQPSSFRGGGRYHTVEAGHWDPASGGWILQPGAPDLGVGIDDVCVADCEDGPVFVSVTAWNGGVRAADATVVLYQNDGGSNVEVGRASVTLAAGERGAPLSFSVPTESAYGWVATIARADGGVDCDPTDNTASWGDRICP